MSFDVDNTAKPGWAPDGYEHVVSVDEDWSVEPQTSTPTCRRPTCSNAPVAWLRRGMARPQWWAYCADHMYGRWVEGGTVKHWTLRKAETR